MRSFQPSITQTRMSGRFQKSSRGGSNVYFLFLWRKISGSLRNRQMLHDNASLENLPGKTSATNMVDSINGVVIRNGAWNITAGTNVAHGFSQVPRTLSSISIRLLLLLSPRFIAVPQRTLRDFWLPVACRFTLNCLWHVGDWNRKEIKMDQPVNWVPTFESKITTESFF